MTRTANRPSKFHGVSAMLTNLQICSTVSLIICSIVFMHCSWFLQLGEAAAKTDKKEIDALRIIATKMGQSKWNFSVDPCSRDSSWYTLDDRLGELGIICNCVFNKNTTCHVIKMALLYEEMTGIVPPELANLTYLDNM
eukprot:Gb_25670 [translate_table: standard]